jgi:hypothetical protein
MYFKDYQEKALTTAVYPRPNTSVRGELHLEDDFLKAGKIISIMYCALGLTGESG